ncbi:hypothetical protein KA977_07005 [Candidatus Dependentiae bacterium]|nr:hypothetical protein [Candidatus Dependentiae bacterium]
MILNYIKSVKIKQGELSSINKIGIQKERSLHSAVKKLYSEPGDLIEHKIGKYVIDIVRNDLLIEIQTSNFSAIKKKLSDLINNYKILVVYPIAELKTITKVSDSGEILSSRKSPKKFCLYDVFDELINIRNFLNHKNFSLEVLIINEEQIRKNDGQGSWRRRGISLIDRKLVGIKEKKVFVSSEDFKKFIPKKLKKPYSNKTFAEKTGISIYKSRKVNYVLKSMGIINICGKNKNELLFDFS